MEDKEKLHIDEKIQKCICPNCGKDNAWKIINDNKNIIGWCECGYKTIVGIEKLYN